MAVILGASSARERGEEAAQLLLEGFAGELSGLGPRSLPTLAKARRRRPTCAPLICGKDAKAYVAARKQAFPYGLKGEPSFLDDTHRAPDL